MSYWSDFVTETLRREHLKDDGVHFRKKDCDGYVEGTVKAKRNISGIMNFIVMINFNANICDWEKSGKVIKRFRTFSEVDEFIKEMDFCLDSISLIRFSERFLDLKFDAIYTEFEEILV